MRFAITPSSGNTDFLVSGGVFTGVMVLATFSGALDGAAREEGVPFIASYGGLAERGLGELVVKGVNAESDIA